MIAAIRVIAVACILCLATASMTIAQEDSPPSHVSFGAWGPTVESRVDPVYPEECREAGVEGTVVLELLISKKEGIPKVIRILRGLDELCEGLDAAAVKAVEQWRFKPFYGTGPHPREVGSESVVMTMTVKFRLDEKSTMAGPPATFTFPSTDGLTITADLFAPHENPATPFIVLFHQAGWSRGEYREILPRLNSLGFNCLAVDQRSGGEVNGLVNETAKRASATGKKTAYLDTLPDLEAALVWARKSHAKGKVIAWGSSYSASLVLWIAGEKPGMIDAVLAFAPGEYFTRDGKPETWIADAAAKINVPVFITSAKKERPSWAPIFAAIPDGKKSSYLPETDGNHGSRALWTQFEDSKGYWEAVTAFLSHLKQK